MKVVLDANVVIAVLIRPDGSTGRRLARADVEPFVPETLANELTRNEIELSARAGIGVAAWRPRVRAFLRGVSVVPLAATRRHARHRLVLVAAAVDPDDACYVAALVACKGDFLWTRDKALLGALPGIAVLVPP